MIVTYSPAEGEQRTWTYRSAELPISEAEDIEETVGATFDEWQGRLLSGSAKARRALLWVLRKRDEPDLKFADVSFAIGELSVEFEPDEKARVRAEVERASELSDDDRAQLLRLLADDGDEAPKASDESRTGTAG